MVVDYNISRFACSALPNIPVSSDAAAAVAVRLLPLHLFLSYANPDPMEPVIIHQKSVSKR